MNLPPYLPPHVALALHTFTKDELPHLTAVWQSSNAVTPLYDCKFIGIRYVLKDGTSMKYTDEEKIEAIRVIEEEYLKEARKINRKRNRWMREEIRVR